jgi:hypothetical protein
MILLISVNLILNVLLILFSALYLMSLRVTSVQSKMEYIIPTTMFLSGVVSIIHSLISVF